MKAKQATAGRKLRRENYRNFVFDSVLATLDDFTTIVATVTSIVITSTVARRSM